MKTYECPRCHKRHLTKDMVYLKSLERTLLFRGGEYETNKQ